MRRPRWWLMWVGLLGCFPLHAAYWAVGVGVGGVQVPDYRGSDEFNRIPLMYPHLVYRGDRWSVERGSVRGLLWEHDTLLLDISMAVAPPVSSEDNQARMGMPDLASAIEVGPSLDWSLGRAVGCDWFIKWPWRGVIGMDIQQAETSMVGWTVSPYVQCLSDLAQGQWVFDVSLGPTWASRSFHQFYYGVSAANETTVRPAYDADSGYGGSRLTLTLKGHVGDYWVGLLWRYDDVRHAAYGDSPLVKSSHGLTVGVAISWLFLTSDS